MDTLLGPIIPQTCDTELLHIWYLSEVYRFSVGIATNNHHYDLNPDFFFWEHRQKLNLEHKGTETNYHN